MAVISTECEVGPKPKLHLPDIFADTADATEVKGKAKQDCCIVFKGTEFCDWLVHLFTSQRLCSVEFS